MRSQPVNFNTNSMRKHLIIILTIALSQQACHTNKENHDASGSFEADEVVVSAELNGRLLNFTVQEGDSIKSGQVVGSIDAENVNLQKEQVQSSIKALSEKTSNVQPQITLLRNQIQVQESQLSDLIHEKERTERLVKADAATGKQLDDINSQIDVMNRQIDVTRQQIKVQENNTNTQNRSILSEKAPLQKTVAQLNNQISKSQIVNPINGVVLTKYAEQGEYTAPGKALYKIADLSYLTLRAYVTGVQLPQIRLNQPVTVLIDKGEKNYKAYSGTITWISDKAEFTPKSIQTKEERANLVYAIKIRVKNDGFLKIGMYADVDLKPAQ